MEAVEASVKAVEVPEENLVEVWMEAASVEAFVEVQQRDTFPRR